MRMHPQIISKNNIPIFVVLPFAEYETILETIEDRGDHAAIQEFHNNPQPTIPWELLQTINKGANSVRVFREFRKISQTELAKRAGISRQYLCQIESKKRQGTSKILQKIAKILDIDIELIIG